MTIFKASNFVPPVGMADFIVRTTYHQLLSLFGKPTLDTTTGYATQAIWNLEFLDGRKLYLYNDGFRNDPIYSKTVLWSVKSDNNLFQLLKAYIKREKNWRHQILILIFEKGEKKNV